MLPFVFFGIGVVLISFTYQLIHKIGNVIENAVVNSDMKHQKGST